MSDATTPTGTPATNLPGDFEPITTQADLDRIVTKRLDRERAKYADYDELKTGKADLEKAKADVDAELANVKADKQKADDRVAELEAEVLRLTVAAEKGVPVKLLTGTTEDELKASADELLKFRGTGQPDPATQRFNGPISGLDTFGQFASRDDEAREIFGL